MVAIVQKYECLNQNTDTQVFCGGDHILDWLSLLPLYSLDIANKVSSFIISQLRIKPKAL